jgi:hypothetical protein
MESRRRRARGGVPRRPDQRGSLPHHAPLTASSGRMTRTGFRDRRRLGPGANEGGLARRG